MTTALDQIMVPKADELILKFGKAISYVFATPGTYQPSTGNMTGATETTLSIRAVISGFSIQEMDGVAVRVEDLKLLVSSLSLNSTKPKVGDDHVVVDGLRYQIINAWPTYSGDQVAAWTLQARK